MRRRRTPAALLAACTLLAGCGSSAVVTGHGAAHGLSPHQIVHAAAPATIQVYGELGPMGSGTYSFGSGVIYNVPGHYALTNAHVIDGVAAVHVRFNDGTQTDATVAGRSPCDDIAVLHLDQLPATARALPVGNSSTVHVADTVSVLGYPASLARIQTEHVVFTQGLVQSVHVRVDQYPDLPIYPDTVQHSATVNHGNSGGPLVDRYGRLIGINTLSNSGTPTEQVQGQYYSISINHITPLLDRLQHGQSIGYAGWDLIPLDEFSLAKIFPAVGFGTAAQGTRAARQLTAANINGLVVTAVAPDTPAATADIRPGELITSIAGQPVTTIGEACSALTSQPSAPITVHGLGLVAATPADFDRTWTADLQLG